MAEVVHITATDEWRPSPRTSAGRETSPSGPCSPPRRTGRRRWRSTPADLLLDYSKHRVTDETLRLLMAVARRAGVEERRDAMFAGEHINTTEDRAVLHVALRMPAGTPLEVDGQDVVGDVHARAGPDGRPLRPHPQRPVDRAHRRAHPAPSSTSASAARTWDRPWPPRPWPTTPSPGSGQPVRLQRRPGRPVRQDPRPRPGRDPVRGQLQDLHHPRDPDQRRRGRGTGCWPGSGARAHEAVAKHFMAVSTNERGGEPSSASTRPTCSGSGTGWAAATPTTRPSASRSWWPSAVSISPRCWPASTPSTSTSAPRRWRRTCRSSRACSTSGTTTSSAPRPTPCCPTASGWPASRPTSSSSPWSRTASRSASTARRWWAQTGEIFWGEPGTNGQHAFYQLLHQGTKLVPADFIAFAEAHPRDRRPAGPAHGQLPGPDARSWPSARRPRRWPPRAPRPTLVPHKVMPGNRPSSTILAPKLTPSVLGQLVALYEHTVFVEGAVWGIDSFDQWGVELGKVMARELAPALTDAGGPRSVRGRTPRRPAWSRRYRRLRGREA